MHTESPRRPARPRPALVLAALFGAAAFVLVLTVTEPPGPGLDPDAMSYLGAAASLVAVGRYDVPSSDWSSADSVAPLTHFPPGFPTAVAGPVALGMTPEQAGRLVVAVAALLAVATLVGTVVAAAGPGAGVVAGLLALVTPALVEVHLSVLSEPLFLACLAAALALMALPRRPRPLALGSVAAAAALVRYAGISVPAATALWTLLRPAAGAGRADAWRARLRDALLVVLPTALLVGAWGARNARLTAGVGAAGAPAGPTRPYLAGFGDDLHLGATTLRRWLAPGVEPARTQGAAAVLAALLLALLVAAAVRRLRSAGRAEGATPDERTVRAWPPAIALDAPVALRVLLAAGLLLAAYAGELVASRLFVFGSIPFDERMLAPVFFLVTAVAATAGRVALGGRWHGRVAHALAVLGVGAALVAWGTASLAATRDEVGYVREHGSDFASLDWRGSPTLAWVRAHGAGRTLFTNWPVAVYFHLGRVSRDLPRTLDRTTLDAFAAQLRRRHGLVVAFSAPSPDVAPPDSIAHRLALRPAARFDDGVVWEAR